jgi:phosphoribosylaminoimidazole-succinocarboxamide synthase
MTVDKIRVRAVFQDWSQFKAWQAKDYPPRRAMKVDLECWDMDKQIEFVQNRINTHLDYPENECTPSEKWADPTTHALMKEGRKSAVRVHEDPDVIARYIADKKIDLNDGKHEIAVRPGRNIRCEDWCIVADFCPYFQRKEPKQCQWKFNQ